MKFRTTSFEREFRGLPETIECYDELEVLVSQFDEASMQKDYEQAKILWGKIESVLDAEYNPLTSVYNPCREYGRTLVAIHDILRSNSIRLNYKDMNGLLYMRLLMRLKNKYELGNSAFFGHIQKLREVVAEEMVGLGLVPQDGRGRKAPNRAFMDILYKLYPNMAKYDLQRREETKL
jgi:hypothetical protein